MSDQNKRMACLRIHTYSVCLVPAIRIESHTVGALLRRCSRLWHTMGSVRILLIVGDFLHGVQAATNLNAASLDPRVFCLCGASLCVVGHSADGGKKGFEGSRFR